METQSYAHHAKFVPAFHFFVMPVLLINVGWWISHLIHRGLTWEGALGLLTAIALFLVPLFGRMFALSVQDRVIRMEERLRLERLLPPDLKNSVEQFTVEQLVGLRFASDAELPQLARKVLNDKIADRKSIKQLIKDWRPDHQRA